MTTIVNTAQAEAWNGYEGAHWARHAERYDAINAGFDDALLAAAALEPADRVLDIGCGNGTVTRRAAARVPRGAVLGIDLSAPMLARAAAALREPESGDALGAIEFRQGDAQVYPFERGGYDVAISRFAIMFFADPVAAFTNVRTALRTGGRVALLSMRDFGDMAQLFAAMAGQLPPLPRPGEGGTGPLSMSDPAVIESVLGAAGFTGITVTPVDATQDWGQDVAGAAAFFAEWGPMRHMLNQAPPEAAALARDAIATVMERFATPEGVRMRGTGQLITARVP